MRIRVKSLTESLKQCSCTGNIKAIAHKLLVAGEKGTFSDKNVWVDMLETVSKNLHASSSRGNRYKASTRELYEVIQILGGPRLANFISSNLNGPCIVSIYTGVHTKIHLWTACQLMKI